MFVLKSKSESIKTNLVRINKEEWLKKEHFCNLRFVMEYCDNLSKIYIFCRIQHQFVLKVQN